MLVKLQVESVPLKKLVYLGFGPNIAFKTTLKLEKVLAGAWFQEEDIII